MTAFDAVVDTEKHSVITGEAPRGIQLTISKRFELDSSAVAITCGPGNSDEKRTVEVHVERGGTACADMSDCPHGPPAD